MSNPNDANNDSATQAEIEQRLAKLRAETSPVFTQKEIEERLARLANRDPNYYSTTEHPIKIYQLISKQNRMTDTEKTDHLMGRLLSELSIDEEYAKDGAAIDAEIERRLAMLRGQAQAQGQGQPVSRSVADLQLPTKPKGTREVIAEILSQPDAMSEDEEEEDRSSAASDDDQWCTTCNEDGVIRCLDCDDDIYCRDCFRELHTDSDMRRHRTAPYEKPRKSNSTASNSKGKKKS